MRVSDDVSTAPLKRERETGMRGKRPRGVSGAVEQIWDLKTGSGMKRPNYCELWSDKG